MLKTNTIYCGNTFDLVKKIDDQSIDLIICDGPYGTTQHGWDQISLIQEYNLNLIKIFEPKLKDGAALYLFGKADCIDFVDYWKYLNLRSKIVWYQPAGLSQGRINYTNNYDLICYFIKGNKPSCYNLDDIRVPQISSERHMRSAENVPSVVNGPYKKTKYNRNGKNPGDMWNDIKTLTHNSKELISKDLNTIQKPKKLIERLVLASSNPGDLVLDPFVGTGTCPLVCKENDRNFIGFEINSEFISIANQRLEKPFQGRLL